MAVSDRKDTKLLKAIHNLPGSSAKIPIAVSDRKDTKLLKAIHNLPRHQCQPRPAVSDRKDTKLLKAIHNPFVQKGTPISLFQTAKIQNF